MAHHRQREDDPILRNLPQVRCSAHKKLARGGAQCSKFAIPGGTVCRYHGGKAPQVIAAAQKRLWDAMDPKGVLRRLCYIADFDPRELLDGTGNYKRLTDLEEHVAKAVASVEVEKRNITAGDGKIDVVLKVKGHDKTKALEMLAKHFGLLTDRLEISGAVDIASRLAAGRQRVADAKRG